MRLKAVILLVVTVVALGAAAGALGQSAGTPEGKKENPQGKKEKGAGLESEVGSLPFTGIDLMILSGVALVLTGTGFALHRLSAPRI